MNELNLVTIDKLLSMLKNRTSTWIGTLKIKEQYLTARAEIRNIEQKNKDGTAVYIAMASISFTAGNPAGDIGINNTTVLTFPLDGITAGVLSVMAQYTLKSVKHISELLEKGIKKETA